MSFDPSTISAQQAALVARCDYQQFQLTIAATNQRSGDSKINFLGSSSKHPFQDYFAPKTSTVIKLFWTARFRGQTYQGPPLYADSVNQSVATAAALQAAKDFLDLVVLRLSRDGANPNPYAPT